MFNLRIGMVRSWPAWSLRPPGAFPFVNQARTRRGHRGNRFVWDAADRVRGDGDGRTPEAGLSLCDWRVRGRGMGGIIGYVGSEPCVDILIEGLRRLEYRGYNSAGVAVVERGCR